MSKLAGEFVEFFTELLFGSGNIFGILIILAIMGGMVIASKWMSIPAIALSVIMAFQYFNNNLGMHGLLMLLSPIFLMIYAVKGKK